MTSPEAILEILRHSLESGESVEIEGLGKFHATRGGYRFAPETGPHVFIAYAAEDLPRVRRLTKALRAGGCVPWMDKEKLIPGQNWPRAIERAIETSDAFIACFSVRSSTKAGHFQSELRYALDCARRLPLDRVFLIPARLENCAVPPHIAGQVQYADLFPDWDRGVERILRSIRSLPPRPRVRLRSRST